MTDSLFVVVAVAVAVADLATTKAGAADVVGPPPSFATHVAVQTTA